MLNYYRKHYDEKHLKVVSVSNEISSIENDL